jgi:protein-S-isoprenylcysteine O-methyltransferase Ste14
MISLLRHLLSILLLPFTVVAVVPYALLRSDAAAALRWNPASAELAWVMRAAGAGVFLAGFALFAWCVMLFARVGRGTLAPWDPTQRLVAAGPYRHVRNPMITGVALMLAGEALLWRSGVLALWLCAFFAINHTYFLLSEEPGIEKRFGDDYRLYRQNVPRWIPRLRPWTGLDQPAPWAVRGRV